MTDMEKLTVNITPVDLGRIDILVDQGLYQSRTDLIRTAIRSQLDRHEPVVREQTRRQDLVVGVVHYSRRLLEESAALGQRLVIRGLGAAVFGADVDAGLVDRAIEEFTFYGVVRAPGPVRARLLEKSTRGRG